MRHGPRALIASVIFAVAGILGTSLLADSATASAAPDQFAQLQSELRRTRASGDVTSFLNASETLLAFLNGSPGGVLQLMSAQSLAGRPEDALRSFEQFVSMGQASDQVSQAKSFDPLRDLPRFQRLRTAMDANRASISSATKVFQLNSSALVPEDIDYDDSTGLFYISTALGKTVLAVDMTGRSKEFAKAPDHWLMMALKVDSRRRLLWLTEVALSGFASVAERDWGRSAILVYDLRTASLLQRIEGPPKSALGDMTLDSNGDAIVSDGDNGGLYRVGHKSWTIDRIDGGDFVSPQTVVVLPDRRHILVPDYVRGIGVLDLTTKHVVWIPSQGMHALSGIDGLYLYRDTLIATQNGTSPERVVRFVIDASKNKILSESIIERATSTLGEPTHGVIVGQYFYYIANSGWSALDDHGVLAEGKLMPVPIVMRARL
jgi:hypothetical protein